MRSASIWVWPHGDDLFALPLTFRLHLLDDDGTLLLRLLAQTGGLVAGLGELSLVLLKNALGLDLSRFGLLDATLDRLAALFQGLVDHRKQLLREDEEDDAEADQADDDFRPDREQRHLRFLGCQVHHGGPFVEWGYSHNVT